MNVEESDSQVQGGGGVAESLSIVIPVYNTAGSLAELVDRIALAVDGLGVEFEIIMVNDASTNPDTWPALQRLSQQDPRVCAIDLTRNFGQQAATLCGFELSRGDYVLTMDDDLQHRPEDIPQLWAERSHDIVIGQFAVKEHAWWKRTTSRLKGWFDHILIGKPWQIQLSSFRLLNRVVVDGLLKIATPYPFIPALMFYVSLDVKGVMVTHSVRREGRSGYTLRKMMQVFANLIINNSSILLKGTGLLGLLFSLLSFLFAGYLLLRKLVVDIPIQGWTSSMLVSSFGIGLVLFTLGVIGEYLIRLVATAECKPVYLMRQREGSGLVDGRSEGE